MVRMGREIAPTIQREKSWVIMNQGWVVRIGAEPNMRSILIKRSVLAGAAQAIIPPLRDLIGERVEALFDEIDLVLPAKLLRAPPGAIFAAIIGAEDIPNWSPQTAMERRVR
ncbi:hypothetical protein [Novosphingobium sp. 9]|uniref:hypothetical protein n=1 Tax=Novosphingobium sp. 9 TaxID=2025349 RepID=UPI0021B61A39|nr:hypothetical protein [Novosphingobium sp. 9]